jgi:hypothetical protein
MKKDAIHDGHGGMTGPPSLVQPEHVAPRLGIRTRPVDGMTRLETRWGAASEPRGGCGERANGSQHSEALIDSAQAVAFATEHRGSRGPQVRLNQSERCGACADGGLP